jgi:NADPH2:quinone reductase
MTALLCKAFGTADSLVLEDITSPTPEKDEIRRCDRSVTSTKAVGKLVVEVRWSLAPKLFFRPCLE